jgi:hypothetical protein
VSDLLAAYDAELRGRDLDPLPDGWLSERDGPVVRSHGPKVGGFVTYRDLGGLDGPELDALIARQVAWYAELGAPFEWKTFAHDDPADLGERLRAAGLVPEERETLVVARLADIAGDVELPDGVALREVTDREDLDRIARMEEAVWQDGHSRNWLAAALEAERAADPALLRIFVVEADDVVVCAAWIRFERGTRWASLWGGGTLSEWRRRGIYRATVRHRANLALAEGYELVQVDASDDSRPILERLGFVAVTTTTPWTWTPR